ncbi:hypothetical protein [Enterococcus columbae]|uniref:Uncharacterized protein n=1 Tax=Enterococcus columbae DSM 7374 = ATCC 51263 TaxID=1121865 RepID=S1NEX6_9ENTE|nr:hypothetical protein [Enterococcus columbae]EOT44930.1 hypothetical protein OMW_00116 [Enterococcus columbae DSM 7374 = ATCC 51263]EOW84223.1 hypothetical protein I568_00710 [Enterococcus columbae DSM 7374 = ATCC 51263]
MILSILNLAFTFWLSVYFGLFVSIGLVILTVNIWARMQKNPTIFLSKISQKMILRLQIGFFFAVLLIITLCNMTLIWQGNIYFGFGLMLFGVFHIAYKYYTKKETFDRISK